VQFGIYNYRTTGKHNYNKSANNFSYKFPKANVVFLTVTVVYSIAWIGIKNALDSCTIGINKKSELLIKKEGL
jgi:hypothetical protein